MYIGIATLNGKAARFKIKLEDPRLNRPVALMQLINRNHNENE